MFANVLRAAIRDSGKRMEIVLVDGFRCEKVGFFSALFQSRYSEESWVAQNSSSSSSLLNCGIGLRLLFIYFSFLLSLWFQTYEHDTEPEDPDGKKKDCESGDE